jgi:hypothetical protein
MRISDMIHIGTRWEYQTYYTYEQDENIRHDTHRNKIRISDIIHIGTRWEYQTWYTYEQDENIRHTTHMNKMRISEMIHIVWWWCVFASSSIYRIGWIRRYTTKLVHTYFHLVMGVWIAIMILVLQAV